MSDEQNSKDKSKDNAAGAQAAGDSAADAVLEISEVEDISDESLDQLIQESDPEFAEDLKKLSQEKSLSATEIELDDSDEAVFLEKEKWSNGPLLLRVLNRFLPFTPRMYIGFKKFLRFLKDAAFLLWVQTKNFTSDGLTFVRKKILLKTKQFLFSILDFARAAKTKFAKLTLKEKLLSLLFVVFVGLTAVYLAIISQTRILQPETPLFLSDLSQVADAKFSYAQEQLEPFYDNLRIGSHMLLIPRMVVNIKTSRNSGTNPMAAMELFLEGFSQEVVVELKDREYEFRDLIQRKIEDFSFDQLDSSDGKQQLQAAIRSELNAKLSTGRVKKVLFKTIIVKP